MQSELVELEMLIDSLKEQIEKRNVSISANMYLLIEMLDSLSESNRKINTAHDLYEIMTFKNDKCLLFKHTANSFDGVISISAAEAKELKTLDQINKFWKEIWN